MQKVTMNVSNDVQFLHTFHLKFTINANNVYVLVESKFSMSIVCRNHHGQYFNSSSITSFIVYCVLDYLIPAV